MNSELQNSAAIIGGCLILSAFILAFAMMKSVPDFDVICKEGSTCIAEIDDE